jgi:NAD(P)-dependent dehydrogenase (short-subunit alcohol dehydrogenase family)
VKHLLIVGASRGLGLKLAENALSAGAAVTCIVREPRDLPKDFAQTSSVTTLKADVRSEEQLARAAAELPSGTQFDVIIYNAAVHLEHDCPDIEEVNVDPILTTLNVNAVGAVRAIKHFRRFVMPGGLIALVSSEAGSINDTHRTSEYGYCMSKAALNMLSRLLANREEERRTGVRVVAVHPGWLRTDMGGPNADLSPDESARALLSTLADRLAEDGPAFIDRLGAPMAW